MTDAPDPLVSVIIIFFNAKKYIWEAITSVFNQRYSNWELLLVDDGSTDGSTEIARQYVELYPDKVRHLEHERHQNRGMSATRNLGIRNAKGDYIAFLDADDLWFPEKLERQVAIMQSYPDAAMLYGATQYWYGWTGNPEDIQRDYIPNLDVEPDRLYPAATLSTLLYPLGKGCAPCPSDLLLRRKMVEQIGGFEDHFRGPYQLYEDQGFLAKMYLKHAVFVSSECWDRYRIHPESCVSTVTGSGKYDTVRQYFLDWFEQYLSREGYKEGPVWHALQEALLPYRSPKHVAVASTVENKEEAPGPSEKAAQNEKDAQWPNLRSLTPVSLNWGFDRGLPIDRYYIENFLSECKQDIQGRTLEIEEDMYTRRFGEDRTTIRDVLHVTEGNPRATMVGDLTRADHIPSNIFDCIVLTQTLQFIYDVKAAIHTLHRILKPGGVLLATFPGITRISHTEWSGSWFWGFTSASAGRLFGDVFSSSNVDVRIYGNVVTAIGFLHGLAAEDLRKEELDAHDPDYELLITVRAVKK
jgi:glycosyltransferase involved in cell wall biosynthesis/SAM-dependent methyltransferase